MYHYLTCFTGSTTQNVCVTQEFFCKEMLLVASICFNMKVSNYEIDKWLHGSTLLWASKPNMCIPGVIKVIINQKKQTLHVSLLKMLTDTKR